MPLLSFSYSIPYVIAFLMIFCTILPVAKTGTKQNLLNNIWEKQQLFWVLFVFLGLRGFIYTDYRLYYPFYIASPSLTDGLASITKFVFNGPFSSWERGFVLYGIVLKTFSSSWVFFESVSWLIDFCVLYWFFKKYIPNYINLAFCFYFIFGGLINIGLSVNLLRNAKALCFFLISIPYLRKNKFLPFIVLNLTGCLFHVSSLLYIPLYFVLNKKISLKLIVFLYILGNILYLLQIEWCVPVVSIIAEKMGGRLGNIASGYISSVKWSTGYGISIGFLERTFTFCLVLVLHRKLYLNNKVFINSLYLYCFSYLYLSEMSILTDRIPLLFIFSYWIMYPKIYCMVGKEKKCIFLVIFFLYSILKIAYGNRSIYCLYDNMLLPDYSFLQRMQMGSRYLQNLGVN